MIREVIDDISCKLVQHDIRMAGLENLMDYMKDGVGKRLDALEVGLKANNTGLEFLAFMTGGLYMINRIRVKRLEKQLEQESERIEKLESLLEDAEIEYKEE